MTIKSVIYIFLCLSTLSHCHHFDLLTVLTRPVGSSESPQGHAMVTRSLLSGLKQLHIPFNYNPSHLHEVGDAIIVLAHTGALSQAISLKKQHPNKVLFAGPNLVVWPSDQNGILLSPYIDKVIVPSEPTRHMYAEISPSIKNRLQIWCVGADTKQWQPTNTQKSNAVLVYWKNQQEGPNLKNKTINLLKKYNWHPIVLEYGKHNHQQYKKILDRVQFGIYLSRSESQGIALAEAWSANVPTLCWNPQERTNRGRVYSAVSSCPYLTDQTGLDWKAINELEDILQKIETKLALFTPRKWVLNNMTDMICAQNLVNIFNAEFKEK